MPRAPSENVVKAKEMFDKGMPMVEIAKKLGVSDGTVRSWKNRYDWDNKLKTNKRNVAKKDDKKTATLQKKKKGGQPGNQNSKGASKGKGNPKPKPPPDRTKHGGYSKVYWDVLSEEEKELIEDMPDNTEILLLQQIQLFSVRERRIMQAINKYRNMEGPVAISFSNRTENKRTFKDEAEEKKYNEIVEKLVRNGERMPGNGYQVFTQTDNKDQIIARLESELSNIQSKKTKAIEALEKFRLEEQKLKGDSKENDIVKAWTEKVLRERRK